MSKEIVVNGRGLETRIAILEDRRLVEIIYERDFSTNIVGNIYKGRVQTVLPGMQAAFVDIGLEKNVFIHARDLTTIVEQKNFRIEDVIQPGQGLLIQVTKESLGDKGPRGTCKLNLAGRYLVLLNKGQHIGISRRISDQEERGRLKEIAQGLLPDDLGVIVRTVAKNKSKEDIKRDLDLLLSIWDKIQKDNCNYKAPYLIYNNINAIKQVIRDKFTKKIDRLIIDNKSDYHQASKLIDSISPRLNTRVYCYDHPKPVFDHYNIEEEIKVVLERKVSLKCGGYIVIDNTEALTAIDVNTGSYVGKDNLEDTVVKTNQEAAKEIAKQLRLRDIGGIIIIDFIDMQLGEDQQIILRTLEEELAKDKTKTTILGLTKLGLVEMTRKKEKERLGEFLQQECPYCKGKARVLSEETIFLEAIRRIKEVSWKNRGEAIFLEAHPKISARLIGSRGEHLENLEKRLNKYIYVKGNKELHIESINIIKVDSKEVIEEIVQPLKVGQRMTIKVEDYHSHNSEDGIARLDGYIIDVIKGGLYLDQEIKIEIIEVNKTYAKAKILD